MCAFTVYIHVMSTSSDSFSASEHAGRCDSLFKLFSHSNRQTKWRLIRKLARMRMCHMTTINRWLVCWRGGSENIANGMRHKFRRKIEYNKTISVAGSVFSDLCFVPHFQGNRIEHFELLLESVWYSHKHWYNYPSIDTPSEWKLLFIILTYFIDYRMSHSRSISVIYI